MLKNILILPSDYDILLTQLQLLYLSDSNIYLPAKDLAAFFSIIDITDQKGELPHILSKFKINLVSLKDINNIQFDSICCSDEINISKIIQLRDNIYRNQNMAKIIYFYTGIKKKIKLDVSINLMTANQAAFKKYKGNKILIRHYPFLYCDHSFAEPQTGFYSYVINFEKVYPYEFYYFNLLKNKLPDIFIKNQSLDQTKISLTRYLEKIKELILESKALFYIAEDIVQDFNICKCLCLGRPIIMPRSTYRRGSYKNILFKKKNVFLYSTYKQARKIIKKLNNDHQYLIDCCRFTKKTAKTIFNSVIEKDAILKFVNELD